MAAKRFIAVRRFSLQKCNERNVLSRKQSGDTLWNKVRTEVVGHTIPQDFQANFNSPRNGPYRASHTCLDALIRDVLKKAAESRRNARLNLNAEGEEEAAGDDDASRDKRAVDRPQSTFHEEKPVRIVFISTTATEPIRARQLPWVICANAMPNKSWLAVLKHYTLQELGEGACRYCGDDEHPHQFIGILHDILGLNVTPDAADQIEFINDDRVNAWLPLSQCTILTVACFLRRTAVNPSDGGNPVCLNSPLVGHYRNYLTPSQFDVAEFSTDPESDSELKENIARPPKGSRAIPRSHNGWQKRILSNDRKVVCLQNHSLELISRARASKREAYVGRYAGQNIPSVALPPGVPPSGCETPLVDADVESDHPAAEDSDSLDGGGNDNWNFVCIWQRLLWAFWGFCSCVSRAFLVFAFIFTHCFGARGLLWLVSAGWGFLGLSGGFSFVSRVFLGLFCSCFNPFVGFSGICFCAGLRLL